MSLIIQQITDTDVKLPVVFNSHYGYNVMFRLGVIYNIKNRSNYIFIMDTNVDLINLSYWFRHFSIFCKTYLKVKKLKTCIKNYGLNFFTNRMLGMATIIDNAVIFSGYINIL